MVGHNLPRLIERVIISCLACLNIDYALGTKASLVKSFSEILMTRNENER